jgi:lipid II:glycine glycyltransferase (peptidoglycan interpeptide bridge formation enzyme)
MKFKNDEKFVSAIKKTYSNCKPVGISSGKNFLPFIFLKSKILGSKIINFPFLDTGSFSYPIGREEIKKVKSLSNGELIEIRMDESFRNFKKLKENFIREGFCDVDEKYQMVLKLLPLEKMWKKFHKHTRNDIRKAEKSGLILKKIDNKKELKKFYGLYSVEMRNFGTPQHSFKFFKNLYSELKDDFFGFNCYKNERIIASAVLFFGLNEAYLSFNVSNSKFRNYRPNDLLYWEIIKEGIKRKIKKISFGQVDIFSEDSHSVGLYKFKLKWLAEPVKRVYFYYPKRNIELDKKDKLKKFRVIWKRMPLFLTKLIGPKIVSQIGI